MSFLSKLKKYLKGEGGIKCLECGYYQEGEGENWYNGDIRTGSDVIPTCPECGSKKTKQGILVTEED